jgi:hypothetical protein
MTIERATGGQPSRSVRWLPWILGAALLAAVIAAATHFAEEKAIVRLAQHVEPWWLAMAVVLQAGTYAAQVRGWHVPCLITTCREEPSPVASRPGHDRCGQLVGVLLENPPAARAHDCDGSVDAR